MKFSKMARIKKEEPTAPLVLRGVVTLDGTQLLLRLIAPWYALDSTVNMRKMERLLLGDVRDYSDFEIRAH